MVNDINILIIDDHPLIVSAYVKALKKVGEKLNFRFFIKNVSSFSEVSLLLNDKEYFESLDFVFLDIRLPCQKKMPKQTGEDIGLKIRILYKDVKIIVSTAVNDNYTIHRVLKGVNPEGFLIKDNITSRNLLYALEIVLKGAPFYSKKVLQLLRSRLLYDYHLDEIDKRILYELSIGTKLKDLNKILPLSLGGIEHRKRNLKKIFKIENGGEHKLLQCARDKGII